MDKVAAPVAIALWLFFAWANGRGHDWSRFLFGAFFGLLTLGMLQALAAGAALLAPADLATGGVTWLIALAATVLVFNKRSNAYYDRRPPASPPPANPARRPDPPSRGAGRRSARRPGRTAQRPGRPG